MLSPKVAPTGAVDVSPFAHSLPLVHQGAGSFDFDIDPSWNVVRGPHGGYLGAALLRAMTEHLDEPSRPPRVLSAHYLRVPAAGPARVQVQVLRRGRTVAWVSAELLQDGLCASARAAFSADWRGVEYAAVEAPSLPAAVQPLERFPGMPPFTRHFEYHSYFSSPLAADGSGQVGGHIRPVRPARYDAELLTVLSDAWFPASFAHERRPVMAATLDLTVYFRDWAALERLAPQDHVVGLFRSRLATEGFFEEDGELWSPEGRLLAQSRQLATATPLGGG